LKVSGENPKSSALHGLEANITIFNGSTLLYR